MTPRLTPRTALRASVGACMSACLSACLSAGPMALLPLGSLMLVSPGVQAQAHQRASQPTPAPRTARYCTNCATVEEVKVVDVPGEAGLMGTAGGAVVGALLGNQVGSGSGRTAATVAGAVGGGIVGRNIERNARHKQRYELVVRYSGNGSTQTLKYDNDPGFKVGDAVRVNNGVLSRDQ